MVKTFHDVKDMMELSIARGRQPSEMENFIFHLNVNIFIIARMKTFIICMYASIYASITSGEMATVIGLEALSSVRYFPVMDRLPIT